MEEFLKDLHGDSYMGTDDDMSDDFDNYMVNLDVDEWLELADKYKNK